jgi:hypothetical protein
LSKMSYKKYQKIAPKKGTFGAKIDPMILILI